MRNPPLSSLPPLPKLGVATLLRALFKRPARAAGTSLDTTYRLDAIDHEHVRRYKAAFGFAGEAVPITYLYLLAQRAQLATLIEQPIPFRIPGLIHVENRLEMHCAIGVDCALALTTDVSLPPPAANGAVLCIVETRAHIGERPAFTCVSTYLIKRGARSTRSEAGQGEFACDRQVGSWTLSSNAGRAYAALSGDWNPIHLWPWTARMMGMRTPIIHGMHSVAQACAMLEQAQGRRMTRLDSRFKSPIALGSEATLVSDAGDGTFTIRCNGRIAVEGHACYLSLGAVEGG
jgi:acyl dehydratase